MLPPTPASSPGSKVTPPVASWFNIIWTGRLTCLRSRRNIRHAFPCLARVASIRSRLLLHYPWKRRTAPLILRRTRLCRQESQPRESLRIAPQLRPFHSMELASLRRRFLPWNMGTPLIFPFGLIAAECWRERASSGDRIREFFAYWINAYLRGAPLKYIGFEGMGFQSRDCLHPRDLVPLLLKQFHSAHGNKPRIINLGGGPANTMSLLQLTHWCAARFGKREIEVNQQARPFDLPCLLCWTLVPQRRLWDWHPATNLETILT